MVERVKVKYLMKLVASGMVCPLAVQGFSKRLMKHRAHCEIKKLILMKKMYIQTNI